MYLYYFFYPSCVSFQSNWQIFESYDRFDVKIAAAVAEETNLPFVTAENKFEALVSFYTSIISIPFVGSNKQVCLHSYYVH